MRTRLETSELATAIALIAIVTLAGCGRPTATSQELSPADGRVDLEMAADLIRAHVSPLPSLKELTTEDVFERMGLQVFIDTGGGTSYVIEQGRVTELCEGFGGHGLQSMCVADLDDDQNLELVFTYSWGSGVHRSHVGICYDNGTSLQTAIAPFWYYGDLLVEREDDQHVAVVVGEYQWDGSQGALGNFTHLADFGEVRLETRDGQLSCQVEVSESLPDELREEIDRDER